jgi:tRNA pseudouridine55 synthase
LCRFSALRIDGKRAYEYARAGQELPKALRPRSVKVSNLEILEWNNSHSYRVPKEEISDDEKDVEKPTKKRKLDWKATEEVENVTTVGLACKLRMMVSGGFYVRSLCYDLGRAVESGAYMAELVRTEQGGFNIEDAVPWEDFVPGGPWEEKVVKFLRNNAEDGEATPVEARKDEKDEKNEKAKVEAKEEIT